MSLILIGLNHRTAPIEVRERLSVPEHLGCDLLQSALGVAGVTGAAIISTCNRVELVVSSDDEDAAEPLVELLCFRSSLQRESTEKHLYIQRGADVVRHLFRVASGLDSMILGEPQITGQVRAAFQMAQRSNALDPVLQQLFETTLRVAKRVRSETGIGEHAVSVPFAAVELARKIFGELRGLRVLLAGAGKIGELTAQHLNSFGLESVFVANRAHNRAVELAERFGGKAVRFESLEEHLALCDVAVVSTSAPHYVIHAADVTKALESRKRRSLFLVDLSVPRNIDPAIAEIEGAYLYNIDDLKEVTESNKERRLQKAADGETIIEHEVSVFLKRLAAHDAVPTILELQTRLEDIRSGELEKCLRRLGPISAEQQQAIEMLSSGIINKVLHYPILRLKESAADDHPVERETFRAALRRIFNLS